MDQKRFAEAVYGIFEPFSILGQLNHQKAPHIQVNLKFDRISVFSLQNQGQKFKLENLEDPANDTGVLDASMSYFIIFTNEASS